MLTLAGLLHCIAAGFVTLFSFNEFADIGHGHEQSIANYKNHRFPPEIIARAVLLYYRFVLSLRHVEECGALVRGSLLPMDKSLRISQEAGEYLSRRRAN